MFHQSIQAFYSVFVRLECARPLIQLWIEGTAVVDLDMHSPQDTSAVLWLSRIYHWHQRHVKAHVQARLCFARFAWSKQINSLNQCDLFAKLSSVSALWSVLGHNSSNTK